MLKSLEDYLSNLSFEPPNPEPGKIDLDSGERAFVEKYLGLDELEKIPELNPEPIPLPQLLPKQRPKRETTPEIIVARPAPVLEIRDEPAKTRVLDAQKTEIAAPELVVAPEKPVDKTETSVKLAEAEKTVQTAPVKVETVEKLTEATKTETVVPAEQIAPAKTEIAVKLAQAETAATRLAEKAGQISGQITAAKTKAQEKTKAAEIAARTTSKVVEQPVGEEIALAARQEQKQAVRVAAKTETTRTSEKTVAAETAPVKTETAEATKTAALAREEAIAAQARAGLSLREKLRQAAEIQVVSFLVAKQIFLLPVDGIQEVIRRAELVKVPQAPEFVAGAINLRGAVLPLIHLSALLTKSPERRYDDKSFVIITGDSSMRMGLIIDRVNSMHIIPQNKFIWNAESKLGEAAEFLSAIVDLDDKVCGMIAPDIITQKLLTEFRGP